MSNHVQSQNVRKTHFLAVCVLVTLFGAALRLQNLGADSLWLDEVLTFNTARNGFFAALDLRDHPPLQYWLTTFLISVGGDKEFTIRFSSVIAGILAVPLLAVLGKASGQPVAGVWAAFLIAVSPFHIRYSQEARHYAWLMTLSLVTYISLNLAFLRGRWRWWLLFGLATLLNLYTHYASLLVLTAELIVIGAWMTRIIWQRRWRIAVQPFLVGGVVLILYSFWFDRLKITLLNNLGENAGPGTTGIAPLVNWLENIVIEFGFRAGILPYVAIGLFISGLLIWLSNRKWLILSLTLAISTLPLILIGVFQLARWSFAKYLIFMLPFFLLSIGVTIDAVVLKLSSYFSTWKKATYAIFAMLVIVIVFLATWPQIRREYDFIERDWKGAIGSLVDTAQEGDIFVPVTLDLSDGFNQGGIVAPFYLDQILDEYIIVDGNELNQGASLKIANSDAQVWVLALDRSGSVPMIDESLVVDEFAGSLYLVRIGPQSAPTIPALSSIYQSLIPVTKTPAPKCLLQHGAAQLAAQSGDTQAAAKLLSDAISGCPIPPRGNQSRQLLLSQLLEEMNTGHVGSDEVEQAQALAQAALLVDRKNEAALKTLTVKDLLMAFEEGDAVLSDITLPEPIALRRFIMPHNGDWGDVLFVHPPGSVSFEVSLPQEPVVLRFRMALAPESWEWGGDGGTFVVRAKPYGVSSEELFRQHIGKHDDELDWHDGYVSLEDYAGQTIVLTLATEAGPAGDATGDWAGWDSPRIMWP